MLKRDFYLIWKIFFCCRNFVAGVLQFQIYQSLCQAAGQAFNNDPRKPLHRCDFYKSQEAGRMLG